MQIKSTLRFPLTPAKMTKINSNKENDDKCWLGFTLFTVSGSANWCSFLTLYYPLVQWRGMWSLSWVLFLYTVTNFLWGWHVLAHKLSGRDNVYSCKRCSLKNQMHLYSFIRDFLFYFSFRVKLPSEAKQIEPILSCHKPLLELVSKV